MKRALFLVLLIACDHGEHRDAREKYNEGVEALTAGKFEDAEKALLNARSSAGVDPELRFRAAYDLGMAYASHADEAKKGKDADLQKALELEQQAVSWFQDAANLKKDDDDTKANLAIVRARAQALTDELSRGEGKLEARLDAVIKAQRGVLDEARGAWIAIKQSGGSDPLAQQGPLTKLADQERGLSADAGVISDLAADEIDSIGKQPADKRQPKDAARLAQLKNLDLYMIESRTKISDARRKLQDLAAEQAVANAEAALVQLKRAREQLLDPIQVLQSVAQDQLQLVQESAAVGQALAGEIGTGSGGGKPLIPSWLEPAALGDRQTGLRDRVEEVRARLAATVDEAQKPGPDGSPPQLKPDQAKLVEQFAKAVPLITEASADMQAAHDDVIAAKLEDTVKKQRDALSALAKAIEVFADLKKTVDIAYATQQQLVQLLGPEAAKLQAAERAQQASEALQANTARMGRIKDLIGEELTKLDDQAKQLENPPPDKDGKAPDPKQVEAAKQQLAQQKQMMNGAEALRADAEKSIAELNGAIKANKDPLTPARAAEKKLDELRKLFFSVIEHLQQLLRDQNETKDQTSQANTEDDFTRAPKLPGLAARETEHSEMAKAITDALGKQADAAQKQQPDEAKKLAAAADEVRQAIGDMTDAHGTLDKAATAKQSVALDPGVKSEQKAIEHLENALKILQPPQKNDQKQDQQKQDQQKQDQQKKDQQQQPQQQQQGGAGQRARDEDAKRQREKQQREGGTDPVDKDW